MVILRSQNKITDFFMILAWASPFNRGLSQLDIRDAQSTHEKNEITICVRIAKSLAS